MNIYKYFDQNNIPLKVLENLSLSLEMGESLGLIGASGSGKSTLLHIICGLEKPDSGKVFIKNNDMTCLDINKRSLLRNKEIGFVYQFHHLLPDLSTLENIALPSLMSGTDKEEAYNFALSLLDQVNLKGKEQSRPNQLSGGERQRVAIARSMSNKPSCLIMDEPTNDLDLDFCYPEPDGGKQKCIQDFFLFNRSAHSAGPGLFMQWCEDAMG